jgi:thiol-disulfide isomerase/thioredoxin
MTKKIVISLAVVIALVSGFLYGKGLLNVHQGLGPPPVLAALRLEKAPKPAPAVAFHDVAGGSHRLSQFSGRYVLLNLWATWCAPCVAELPALAKLSRLAPGLKVVAVDVGRDGAAQADAFLKSHQAGGLSTYVDSDIALVRAFGAYGLPMTVLIGPDGKVVAKAEGPAAWDDPASIAYFKRITGS